jgi:hypothetical protein
MDPFQWTPGVGDQTPMDFEADLLDLDTGGGDVSVRVEMMGRKAIPHSVSASWVSNVGTTPLWTNAAFFGRTPFVSQQSFSAALASFGVNRLRLSGSSPDPAGSLAALDAFEVTYPRFYVARNNRLACTSGGVTDSIELRFEGFTAPSRPEVHAYDVTDWANPVRLVVGPSQVVTKEATWRVFIQDWVPAAGTRRYVVATDVPRLPDETVTAAVPSSLYLTPADGARLVIVVHDDFAADVEPLAAFRRGQGIATLVAKAGDVYDEFNGGRKSQFAIRRFLRYALATWNTRYVLLVGDASEDPQGWLGTGDVDFVPTPVINSPVGVSDGASTVFEIVPTDNWYVLGLSGPEGSGTDLLVDMIIGRWTAGTPAEVQGLVAKSIAYETTGSSEPWRHRATLVADDDFSASSTFGGPGGTEYCQRFYERVFEEINRDVDRIIRQEAGYSSYDIRTHYLSELLAGLPRFSGATCDTARDLTSTRQYVRANVTPALVSDLSEGAAFVNFQGHGNAYVLTFENLLVSQGTFQQDLDLIQNDGRPWFFTSFTAHFNNYASVREGSHQFGDAFGERLVNAPAKGAIACFSSTALEVLPFSATNHLDNHVYRALFVDPPADSSRPGGPRVVLGEAAALGVARMVATNPSQLERKQAWTYVFLGDPVAGAPQLPPVDVPGPGGSIAAALGPCQPNPARHGTSIGFTLPGSSSARLAIYDVAGRRVRLLAAGSRSGGSHWSRWDGRDDEGRSVTAGLYFYRLDAVGSWGTHTATRRLIWLR